MLPSWRNRRSSGSALMCHGVFLQFVLMEDAVSKDLVIHFVVKAILHLAGLRSRLYGTRRRSGPLIDLARKPVLERRTEAGIRQGQRLCVNESLFAIKDMKVNPCIGTVNGLLDPRGHAQDGLQVAALRRPTAWWRGKDIH